MVRAEAARPLMIGRVRRVQRSDSLPRLKRVCRLWSCRGMASDLTVLFPDVLGRIDHWLFTGELRLPG